MRAGLAATLLLASLLRAGAAHGDVVERVVAVVNDEAIFLSDLRKRAVPFLPRVADAPTETERLSRLKSLYTELLQVLIDEELLRQLASESQIVVTNDEVDRFIENIRMQNNLTEEEFWEAVASQGMSETQYRRDLKRQIMRFKVTNERVRSRVNITEEEVRRKYEQRAREKGDELRFRLSHIVVAIDDDATATQVAAARDEADDIRSGLTPDNFEVVAAEYGGGELGWVAQGDLPEDLQSALIQTPAGDITQPIRSGSGFHIFLVQQRQVGEDFPSYDEMKEELFREMLDAAMARQERIFLEELRRKAVINRML